MKCPKCTQDLRIGIEQVGIDSNNLPVFHRHGYCDYCKIKIDIDIAPPPVQKNNRGIVCPCCGGNNINISIETVGETNHRKSETRKKSIVTRAGNSMGRAGMIAVTGGLWALTPKKSKYKTTGKGKTDYIQRKIAICQQCGNSWQVY